MTTSRNILILNVSPIHAGRHALSRLLEEAGFDAHMVKPVDHEALAKLLDGLPSGPRWRRESCRTQM